jgi:hypothetical protein
VRDFDQRRARFAVQVFRNFDQERRRQAERPAVGRVDTHFGVDHTAEQEHDGGRAERGPTSV